MWGHKVIDKGGPKEATRAQYNRAYGASVPVAPQVPECWMHIWDMWWRLSKRRPASDSISPIQFTEIRSFLALSGEALTHEELQLIEAMDDAYIGAIHKERAAMIERDKEAKKS